MVHVTAVLFVAWLSLLGVNGQANGGICMGQVGGYQYNLQPLSDATGAMDQQCKDSPGNTYFYRPCYALQQQQCISITDPTPAMCMKDTRKIPQFHDVGSASQVVWSPRPAGPNTGFFIQFNGGEEDRRGDIEFICDMGAGTGVLAAANPTEAPVHFYHLTWRTAYACPEGAINATLQCCKYVLTGNSPSSSTPHSHFSTRRANKAICDTLPHLCPLTLGAYRFAGNTTVSSCDECAMPRRLCCFYANPNDRTVINTHCTTDVKCPAHVGNNDFAFVGDSLVDSCDDCFFA